jgi:hypothetical protein
MARATWLGCARRQLSSFLREGLFHAGSSAREFKRNKVGHCASRPGQQCRAIDPALPLQLERKRDAGNPSEDGGQTAIAMATPDLVNDVVNFAPVTTGSNAIFWVDAQLKQPTSALFAAELFTSRAGFLASPLPSQIIGITNGSTYSSPTPYGRCPALLTLATDHRGPCHPVCSINGTVTLAVGIGH